MEFFRQEYWSGLPFPSPGDLPDPEIKPMSPALASGFFTTELLRKPTWEDEEFEMLQRCMALQRATLHEQIYRYTVYSWYYNFLGERGAIRKKVLKSSLVGWEQQQQKRLRGTTPQENNCRLFNKDPQYQVHPGEDSWESLGLQGDQTSPS